MAQELPLSGEEIDELSDAAAAVVGRHPELGEPEADDRVEALAALIERVRWGDVPVRDEDVFGLGAIWLLTLAEIEEWEVVRVTWPAGHQAEAVVSPDRGVACLPLHHVRNLLDDVDRENDLVATFTRLSAGERPKGAEPGRYAVLL